MNLLWWRKKSVGICQINQTNLRSILLICFYAVNLEWHPYDQVCDVSFLPSPHQACENFFCCFVLFYGQLWALSEGEAILLAFRLDMTILCEIDKAVTCQFADIDGQLYLQVFLDFNEAKYFLDNTKGKRRSLIFWAMKKWMLDGISIAIVEDSERKTVKGTNH